MLKKFTAKDAGGRKVLQVKSKNSSKFLAFSDIASRPSRPWR
jgi:hypothetical protein